MKPSENSRGVLGEARSLQVTTAVYKEIRCSFSSTKAAFQHIVQLKENVGDEIRRLIERLTICPLSYVILELPCPKFRLLARTFEECFDLGRTAGIPYGVPEYLS